MRFDLREFGEGPNSQSEMVEASVSEDISRRSSEVLRQENRSGGSPSKPRLIPSRTVMRYPEGTSPGSSVDGYVDSNSLPSPRSKAAPATISRSGATSGNGTKNVRYDKTEEGSVDLCASKREV